ncbi:MAG: MFS transporter [Rhodospirillales bacterium]|nr:MFS transporter [Rhodospirillales bacterium]
MPTRLPAALTPLRHTVYRRLWLAYVITSLGTWLQNTGAGWLMTSLSPSPLVVAMVQAATILPAFLLALPGGALADIIDKRRFLIGTQAWTMVAAALLAGATLAGHISALGLLSATFAIGIGAALTAPAWAAIVPELVPRGDLVGAIALNGIGFNIARALGPALAGFLVLAGGSGLAFSCFAVSIVAVIWALAIWRRRARAAVGGLPREHLLGAMRAGMRFVRHSPAMRAAMLRIFAYSLPAAAPWSLLPLVVRRELGLGPGMYGLILGLMGGGGVLSGLLLPRVTRVLSRGGTVMAAGLASATGMVLLGLARNWELAAFAMALFGTGWVASFSVVQAAAQLVAPPWVRARSLAIYQLAYNGALTLGAFGWGWLGGLIGLPATLLAAGISGGAIAVAVRGFSLDQPLARPPAGAAPPEPEPEAPPAPELAPLLARGHLLETVRYRVDPGQRGAFLALLTEIREARGRAGVRSWQLYEDVTRPDAWMEVWSSESWTDHLRETARLAPADLGLLARVAGFRLPDAPAHPRSWVAVDPERAAEGREAR